MPVFRVLDKATKATVYAYSSDVAVDFPEFPFAAYDHIEQIAINPDRSIDQLPGRELSKYEWRRLFTDAERLAIDRFNATFESNAMLTEPQRDAVRSGLEDYKAATVVNKDDPATGSVLGLYTALGILAPGRAAEILA